MREITEFVWKDIGAIGRLQAWILMMEEGPKPDKNTASFVKDVRDVCAQVNSWKTKYNKLKGGTV